MRITNITRKTTACLLAVLMFASALFVAPITSYAVENEKPTASLTQIAAGSTVMIKKGALEADTLENISSFWTIFEFYVKEVKDGVASITYTLDLGVIQSQYGFDADTLIKLIGLDEEEDSAAITAIRIAMAVGNAIQIPISKQVKLEDLILVKDGIKSTRQELKYIGKEATINQGAIDVYGNEINKIWCILRYDITTVVGTTAHLQCRLTPGYLEEIGVSKETFGNMIGVDPSNILYDTLYKAATAAGYTLNFDIDVKYLNVAGVTSDTDTESDTESDTETETDTESDTDTEKEPVRYGDVDNNKKVDLVDVTTIQKYLANLVRFTSSKRIVADVTGDNKVDLVDVTTIQKYLANLIDEFPAQDSVG